jgi:hypothetical protein
MALFRATMTQRRAAFSWVDGAGGRLEVGRMRASVVVLSTAVLLALLAPPAQAYLDPGTGSYVFQMVVAALVSVGFLVRAYWHRLRSLFARRNPSPPAPPDER